MFIISRTNIRHWHWLFVSGQCQLRGPAPIHLLTWTPGQPSKLLNLNQSAYRCTNMIVTAGNPRCITNLADNRRNAVLVNRVCVYPNTNVLHTEYVYPNSIVLHIGLCVYPNHIALHTICVYPNPIALHNAHSMCIPQSYCIAHNMCITQSYCIAHNICIPQS